MIIVIGSTLVVFLVFGAFAMVGALTVKRAKETALKVASYVVMVVSGFFAVVLPLLFLWSFPASERRETAVKDCEFFSSQQEVQHFLEKARDSYLRPKDTVWWLDQDNDGIACEEAF